MTDPLDLDALKARVETNAMRVSRYPSYSVRQLADDALALLAALKEAQAGLADAWDAGASEGAASMYHGLKATPNPYRRTETP